jgi:demethylmenaquinone methyltransferase/2-methoxy-6-polyprenyl-1,4-benzoquinol methylase
MRVGYSQGGRRVNDEVEQILREQARYYEDRAPEYDDVWHRRGIYDLGPEGNRRWFEETACLEAAVDELDATGTVLELAAGTGLFTQHLAARARRLIAVDAAASALAINRGRVTSRNVEFVHADLFTWSPPRDRRFDLIAFAFLISHIPPERFGEFWERLAGWLAPGGRVFFCDDVAGAETRRSNPGEAIEHDLEYAHRRRLTDGREYRIVKIFYRPDELSDTLSRLGWRASISTTGMEFYFGVATREPA